MFDLPSDQRRCVRDLVHRGSRIVPVRERDADGVPVDGPGGAAFCPRCGTHLTFEHQDLPDEIDVSTCSLDDPNGLPPKMHIHTSSRLDWIRLADGLPEHRGEREARSG